MLIIALIFLISLFAAAKVYYLTKENVKERILHNEFLKNISSKVKKSDIKEGYEFQANIVCRVLGTFFDQDDKYCITCPVIDEKLVGIPTIARVSDDLNVQFGDTQSKEMLIKGRTIYRDYLKNNRDKFLNIGDM